MTLEDRMMNGKWVLPLEGAAVLFLRYFEHSFTS
jgi:hypothetical protein